MKKLALFAFQGDPVCFVHVLLNALDMNGRDHDVQIIVEGQATGLIADLAKKDSPQYNLYLQAKEKALIAGVCKACSKKLGVLDAVKKEGLTLLDHMSGHPSMAYYLEEGYEIITF